MNILTFIMFVTIAEGGLGTDIHLRPLTYNNVNVQYKSFRMTLTLYILYIKKTGNFYCLPFSNWGYLRELVTYNHRLVPNKSS